MERGAEEEEEERRHLNPNVNVRGGDRWLTIDGPLGLKEEESMSYARTFFKAGFFFLPWLWAVNCYYFFPVLRNPYSSPAIRPCFFLNPRFQYQEGFEYNDSIRSGVTKVIERLAPNVTFAIEATRELAQFRGKIGRFGDLTAQTAIGIMNPDVVGSAIGFVVFTVILCSWALAFAIGGERLFGPVWQKLVMYNVADRLGLTGWN